MNQSPFAIFKPYRSNIDVRFLTKSDAIRSDEDVATKLSSENLVTLKQVHGTNTVTIRSPQRRLQEADGVVTDTPDLWLAIRIADCQPLVFYAPRRQVGGLLHVGWRGLNNGAIRAFLQDMEQTHGIPAEELLVGIGPSICTECAEFTDPVSELAGINPTFIHGRHADLRGAADQQLKDWGVKAHFIERSPECTKCMRDTYWSYRAEPEMVKAGDHNVLAMKIRKI